MKRKYAFQSKPLVTFEGDPPTPPTCGTCVDPCHECTDWWADQWSWMADDCKGMVDAYEELDEKYQAVLKLLDDASRLMEQSQEAVSAEHRCYVLTGCATCRLAYQLMDARDAIEKAIQPSE